ncbi:transposase [Shewanella surugensis]|uniref:transposase n=1 Tax=Shewanella surugensis TaxID=212020 RepID=UPI0035E37AE7
MKRLKNSGFVGGLNNKIKVVKRRCYGFTRKELLFQRLTLDLHTRLQNVRDLTKRKVERTFFPRPLVYAWILY